MINHMVAGSLVRCQYEQEAFRKADQDETSLGVLDIIQLAEKHCKAHTLA